MTLKMNGAQLTDLQLASAMQVGMELTDACPLQCRHCITESKAKGGRRMSIDMAMAYAGQFPALRSRGVRLVNFFGGEPFLAPRQLALLSESAARAGIASAVTTSCFWAKDERAVRRMTRKFPFLQYWVLSTDIYHAGYVDPGSVLVAAGVLAAEGIRVSVRMTTARPVPDEHHALKNYIETKLPPGVSLDVQYICQAGRAKHLPTDIPTGTGRISPCVPGGMVVRCDGTVAPCCAALVNKNVSHPFQFNRAGGRGLAAIHEDWCTDPLFQLIRTAGFFPLLEWLADIDRAHPLLRSHPEVSCDFCLEIWKDPAVAAALRLRAERQETREKIARLAYHLFQEKFMLEETLAGSGG